MVVETNSETETEEVGERLARVLTPGSVVGITGPLGAGKTVLVRGIARGCGVAEGVVHSPTFLTAAQYDGAIPVAHIDLYRHDAVLPASDWLAELLDGEGIAVVEWFERLGVEAPDEAVLVDIRYGSAESTRVLDLAGRGERASQAVAALAAGEQR